MVDHKAFLYIKIVPKFEFFAKNGKYWIGSWDRSGAELFPIQNQIR